MKDKVIFSQWLKDMTFWVEFTIFDTEDGAEQIVMKWHQDEDRWVTERYYYDMEGDFMESVLITNMEMYLMLANEELVDAMVYKED